VISVEEALEITKRALDSAIQHGAVSTEGKNIQDEIQRAVSSVRIAMISIESALEITKTGASFSTSQHPRRATTSNKSNELYNLSTEPFDLSKELFNQ